MTFSPNEFEPFLTHGDFSDIYLERSHQLSIRWEDGSVESVTESSDSGLGLKVLKGSQIRYGHLDSDRILKKDLTPEDKEKLHQLHKRLVEGLSSSPIKEARVAPIKQHPIQKPPDQYALDQKINFLKRCFAACQGSSLIRQITIHYGEKKKHIGYLNSLSDSFEEERTYLVLSVMVTAERGSTRQRAYDSMGGLMGLELFDENRLENIARVVSSRALEKLNAPLAPAGSMPVVLAASAGGTLIHEAIGHSLEADHVLEGTSPPYQGKIGQVVGHEKLTVFDDPTLPHARGSYYFDDEGVPSQSTKLIENGVLKEYLFDRHTALRANRSSNGHGRRESYAHIPIPRMSNTFIAPGPDDPREIVQSLQEGFLVTKMGGGQVNTANGDFIFEVEEGYHVVGGKKTLVRGATLLGNGPEVLKDIDKVGSDLGWGIGTCGKEGQGVPVSDAIPTIRIKKLVIGGG